MMRHRARFCDALVGSAQIDAKNARNLREAELALVTAGPADIACPSRTVVSERWTTAAHLWNHLMLCV